MVTYHVSPTHEKICQAPCLLPARRSLLSSKVAYEAMTSILSKTQRIRMTDDDFLPASLSLREGSKRKKVKQKRDKNKPGDDEVGKLTASSPELNGGHGDATETEARLLRQVLISPRARHIWV